MNFENVKNGMKKATESATQRVTSLFKTSNNESSVPTTSATEQKTAPVAQERTTEVSVFVASSSDDYKPDPVPKATAPTTTRVKVEKASEPSSLPPHPPCAELKTPKPVTTPKEKVLGEEEVVALISNIKKDNTTVQAPVAPKKIPEFPDGDIAEKLLREGENVIRYPTFLYGSGRLITVGPSRYNDFVAYRYQMGTDFESTQENKFEAWREAKKQKIVKTVDAKTGKLATVAKVEKDVAEIYQEKLNEDQEKLQDIQGDLDHANITNETTEQLLATAPAVARSVSDFYLPKSRTGTTRAEANRNFSRSIGTARTVRPRTQQPQAATTYPQPNRGFQEEEQEELPRQRARDTYVRTQVQLEDGSWVTAYVPSQLQPSMQ